MLAIGERLNEMMKNYPNEEWRLITDYTDLKLRYHIEISSYGRLRKKLGDNVYQILKVHLVEGYPALSLRNDKGKGATTYAHRLMAMVFLEKPSKDHIYVIHLDYNKKNNRVENLRWATKKEKETHQFTNPNRKPRKGIVTYSKLTEAKVRLIKKKINDPNRKTRLKIIAKQFGISEMQLYRIKRGENWGHIK